MISPRGNTVNAHTSRLGESTRTPFLGKNAWIQGLPMLQDRSVGVRIGSMGTGLCATAVFVGLLLRAPGLDNGLLGFAAAAAPSGGVEVFCESCPS